MVVGILLATSTSAFAHKELIISSDTVSFGWFKKLDEEQMSMYNSAIVHALLNADNGEKVRWNSRGAKGHSVILSTIPTSSGYCRTMYTEVHAFNSTRTGIHRYCYNNGTETWSRVKTH